MKNQKNMRVIITLLLFFTIYYPPIIQINTIHIMAIVSGLYLITHKEARELLSMVINRSLTLLLLLVYLIQICLLSDHLDNVIGLFVLTFEILPIACTIISLVKDQNKYSIVRLDNLIIAASTMQAIIAIAAFFIPSLQTRIIDWYIAYGFRDVFLRMARWRLFGFSYTMAFAMPIVQGGIAAYCLYKAINERVAYFLPVMPILFSAIINARIGIVVFAIGSVSVLLASLEPKKLLSIVVAIILLYLIPSLFMKYLTNESTRAWIQSGVDSIFAFMNRTSYASDSYFLYATDAEKYTLPSSVLGVVFGEGHIARGEGVYATDVGYVNDIWLGGLIYCISIVMFFIHNTMKIVCHYENRFQSRIWLFVGITAILLASNIKGRVFSWNEVTVLWLIIYVSYLSDEADCQRATHSIGYSRSKSR